MKFETANFAALGFGALLVTLLNLAWISGLVWIVVHFVRKFW